MILSWNITKRCNLYCEHCYRESEDKAYAGELTTQEGLKLIDEIAATGVFRILILSGGEPLVRDDLEVLAAHAAQKGLIPVLGTNGTLMTKARAKSLKESGIRAAGISIDSVSPGQHDAFRNTPGCYEKTLEGIGNCIEAGIRVQINTTITKDNRHEIKDIIDAAIEMGASAVHPFFLVETGRGTCLGTKSLEDKDYIGALTEILRMQKDIDIELKPTCAPQYMSIAKELDIPMRFTRGCIAGIAYCCILPNGKVHICPYLPIEAGDVRQQAFDKLWAESHIFNELRESDNYEGKCGDCSNHSICGGCRARAYTRTGNYMSEDPMARYCYREKVQP